MTTAARSAPCPRARVLRIAALRWSLLALTACVPVHPAPPSPPAPPPGPPFVPPLLEYRCHGTEAWVRLEVGARDCTGRFPMFPEGDVDPAACPNGVGMVPDTPWRRAQAGTADWRVVDAGGAVLTEVHGACLDSVEPLRGASNVMRCGAGSTVESLLAAPCSAQASTAALLLYWAYPWGFSFETVAAFPPYSHAPR